MQLPRDGRKIQMMCSNKTERTIMEKQNRWDETGIHAHTLLVKRRRGR